MDNEGSTVASHIMQLAYLLKTSGKRMYGKVAGLTATEWPIVTMLIREGEQTVGDICVRLDRDKAPVSRDVASLVERGLVTKDRAAEDARQVMVRLAPEATVARAAMIGVMKARADRLTAGLSAKDVETFDRILQIMVRNAQDMRGDR
ncbi:MAG TPA: MarR family winged helix-turn-helix transcriptional regulator [Caulobacteraceae bacterium]|jgi:DNA-binding MarR family transcriptional regulator